MVNFTGKVKFVERGEGDEKREDIPRGGKSQRENPIGKVI